MSDRDFTDHYLSGIAANMSCIAANMPDRRERIATAAMAGMLANEAYARGNCLSMAQMAVVAADALIAELDKPKEVQP